MKALKLENRSIELIEIDSTSTSTELEGLQCAVGGWIEIVRIAEDAALIVDEEGLLKCLNQNALASLVAHQMIVGTAVIVGMVQNEDGETVFTDCPQRYIDNLLLLVKEKDRAGNPRHGHI